MAVTKEQVLASLHGVASPDGTPLPQTGTLSDVVAGDGKVFFSITVDAGEVKAWESVRKRAEEAVRALPGVQSAAATSVIPLTGDMMVDGIHRVDNPVPEAEVLMAMSSWSERRRSRKAGLG
jgi:hypothetical protein